MLNMFHQTHIKTNPGMSVYRCAVYKIFPGSREELQEGLLEEVKLTVSDSRRPFFRTTCRSQVIITHFKNMLICI